MSICDPIDVVLTDIGGTATELLDQPWLEWEFTRTRSRPSDATVSLDDCDLDATLRGWCDEVRFLQGRSTVWVGPTLIAPRAGVNGDIEASDRSLILARRRIERSQDRYGTWLEHFVELLDEAEAVGSLRLSRSISAATASAIVRISPQKGTTIAGVIDDGLSETVLWWSVAGEQMYVGDIAGTDTVGPTLTSDMFLTVPEVGIDASSQITDLTIRYAGTSEITVSRPAINCIPLQASVEFPEILNRADAVTMADLILDRYGEPGRFLISDGDFAIDPSADLALDDLVPGFVYSLPGYADVPLQLSELAVEGVGRFVTGVRASFNLPGAAGLRERLVIRR